MQLDDAASCSRLQIIKKKSKSRNKFENFSWLELQLAAAA
jgi:hypothetical protein